MVATAAQMKELDRQAIEEYGIPSLDLMERAALGVAGAVWSLVGREDEDDGVIGGADGPIAVLVGGPDPAGAGAAPEPGQRPGGGEGQEQGPLGGSAVRPGQQRRGRGGCRPHSHGAWGAGSGPSWWGTGPR